MMRTPDGHGRLELMKFHRPPAVSGEPKTRRRIRRAYVASCSPSKTSRTSLVACAPMVPNSLASRRKDRDKYRLCYVRGPEGIIGALAEQLS